MKLVFGGIHVLQTIRVQTEDGMTELEFPSSMTREAIIQELANIMKRKVSYSIHNDVYTIHREEEEMKFIDELKQIAETAKTTKHKAYIDYVREEARKAAAVGAGAVEVHTHPDAYYCREEIGRILSDEDGLNVKTWYVKNRFSRDVFVIRVSWSDHTHYAVHHKDKEKE